MTEQNQTVVKGKAPTTGSIMIKKKTRFQRWKGAIVGTALAASIVAGAIIGLRECGQKEEKECKTSCSRYEQIFKMKFEEKCVRLDNPAIGLPPLLEGISESKTDGGCKGDECEKPKCNDGEVVVCFPVPEPVKPAPKAAPAPKKQEPRKPICGDGKCEAPKENVYNCAEDCGRCGDGIISPSIGEKCEKGKGCEEGEKCVACRRCEPLEAVKACDPKLVTDDRAFKYELAANSGLKSMASQLAGMSIHGTVDICIKERKITVSLKPGATADADLLRQAKRAIVEKVRAVGYPPLDMRFTFGMDDIRP